MVNEIEKTAVDDRELRPLVGFGPYLFGADVMTHVDRKEAVCVPDEYDEDTQWHSYSYPGDDGRLYVEGQYIVSISIHKSAKYNGHELIGLNRKAFEDTLGVSTNKPPELIEMPFGTQEVIEYDSLSLQVWFKNSHVVTLIASGEDE